MPILGRFDTRAVSTHSRPKAADIRRGAITRERVVSTHSRPKAAVGTLKSIVGFSVFQHTAARRRLHHQRPDPSPGGRFNTQPPEGGCISKYALKGAENVSTHSRPKAAGVKKSPRNSVVWFQHTAARRRLPQQHPRAGALHRFNTQPPEGGWREQQAQIGAKPCFNTQPPEGG